MDSGFEQRWGDLYTPSIWSKRYPIPEEALNAFETFTKMESERVRRTIPFEEVKYGETFPHETYDIYGIDLPKDAPIFVYIHGGYWTSVYKTTSAYPVEPLYKSGHKVIVVDYDLCPVVTLEQLVDQVQRACAVILDYATSIGSKGVQIGGHSAGGHLAMCVFNKLVQDSSPFISILKSVYLFAGIFDLYEFRYMEPINPNNELSLNKSNIFRLSPVLFEFDKWTAAVTQRGKTATAFHIFVAMIDGRKIVGQAHCLERLLALHEYPNFDLFSMENVDHFEIVEDLSKPDYIITKTIISEAKSFALKN